MKLPKQRNLPYVGGICELLAHDMFWFSIMSFMMMIIVTYSTNQTIQNIFQSFWVFLFMFGVVGVLVSALNYSIFIPSRIGFIQKQSIIDGRNPMLEILLERLDDIENQINELKSNLEDDK